MDCIENVLGLKGGCTELSSTQSVFLNSYVNYNELAQIVDGNEQSSVDDFFRERRALAVQQIIAEIQDYNRPSYKFPSIVVNDVAGEETEDLEASQVTSGLVGLALKRRDPNTYLMYRVNELMLFLNYTGNVTVLAIDLDTGVTLESTVIATTAGVITSKYVEWLFPNRNIAIVFDATGKNGYRTRLHGDGCAACNNGWVSCNNAVNGKQVKFPALVVTNNTALGASDLGGLKVRYNVECDHATWLCSIRANLAIAMLCKTSELIMEYAIFQTARENVKTKLDRTLVEKRQLMYNSKYAEAMTRLFSTMTPPSDPKCFVCKRTSKYVTML